MIRGQGLSVGRSRGQEEDKDFMGDVWQIIYAIVVLNCKEGFALRTSN